jgi:DNA repair protein RadC
MKVFDRFTIDNRLHKVVSTRVERGVPFFSYEGLFNSQSVGEMSRDYADRNFISPVSLKQGEKALDSLTMVGSTMQSFTRGLDYEIAMVAYLNDDYGVEFIEKHNVGSSRSCNFYMEEVVSSAVMRSCSSVIVGHNHPNGACFASNTDIKSMRSIARDLNRGGVSLLDDIIFTDNDYKSMRDLGHNLYDECSFEKDSSKWGMDKLKVEKEFYGGLCTSTTTEYKDGGVVRKEIVGDYGYLF